MFEEFTRNRENFSDSFRKEFDRKDMLSKLIFINIFVFILLLFAGVVFFLLGRHNYLSEFLSVPASLEVLAHRPWGLFTYMFTHEGFFHLLFNIILLYWVGRMFLQYFNGNRLLFLYLLGGIGGALLYIVAFNTLPVFAINSLDGYTIGASASVVAIFFAVAFYDLNKIVSLFFWGKVKLFHLALFFLVFDLLMIPGGNSGGHISHFGGALVGFLFALWMKQFPSVQFSHKKKPNYEEYATKKDYAYNSRKKQQEDNVNDILDKISKSGYESLSAEERKILFKSSFKNKGK